MPNIFKAFSRAKAEPYQFPDAAELAVEPEPEEEPPAPEEGPPEEAARLDVRVDDPEPVAEPEAFQADAHHLLRHRQGQVPQVGHALVHLPVQSHPESPISYAQLQAEVILADARREAEALMAKSREDARREAEEVFAKAREDGRQERQGSG